MAVTLFHTRLPHDEFILDSTMPGGINDDVDTITADERARLYRTRSVPLTRPANRERISGLWCTMLMVVGPQVHYASFQGAFNGPLKEGQARSTLTFNNRPLHVVVGPEQVTTQQHYTAVERFRTNSGEINEWGFGYVRLMARDAPYDLRNQWGNTVVQTLRTTHNGECIRIYGGSTAQQRNILIHEAPQPGWVVGCIGPRPHNDKGVYSARDENNPSAQSVREIMRALTAYGANRGQLFVLRD